MKTGIQVLAAAYLALNQRGDGSSPSSPTCTRDVRVACLLAMQDVRVRFPLGALIQDVGKPGNPPVSGTGKRGFKSHRPDSFCALGRAAKALVFQTSEVGSIPTGHSWGSANGRLPGFEPGDEDSTASPRTLSSEV